MRKIVLDTNCLLISLPKISPYRTVWDAFLRGSYQLCVSNEMIEEYLEILSLKINPRIATNVVSTILSSKHLCFVTPYYKFGLIRNDVDDNKFVDCAIAIGAECIVSNDAHFRILQAIPFPAVKVMDIASFAATCL